jgi:hypothetical protein
MKIHGVALCWDAMLTILARGWLDGQHCNALLRPDQVWFIAVPAKDAGAAGAPEG